MERKFSQSLLEGASPVKDATLETQTLTGSRSHFHFDCISLKVAKPKPPRRYGYGMFGGGYWDDYDEFEGEFDMDD